MATPSGKNNPTPSQITSSPFQTGAATMGRPLSHKSPSIRTPSASGLAHLNHPSTSSQQYPTPLAAATSVEDAAAFSSPSALLALGLGGNTPSLGGANDALVGQGMGENDMPGMEIPALGMAGPRDNDAEKRKRLDEMLRILRTRVAGRGVCREGVERLGKLEGLECLWQEDNLSIAGNFVDLEIEFVPGKECVKDVVLRYATPEAEEGEKREEASAVLKRNLAQSPEDQERGFWKDMADFHENLKQLAAMDHLSQQVNCFQAVEGLYESLKRIWEEQRQVDARPLWEHVCTGSVGRPCMHLYKTLGLSLQYWVKQKQMLGSSPQQKSDDKMDIDRPTADYDDEICDRERAKFWSMVIDCEEGYPSLRMSKEWVSPAVHTTVKDGDGTGNVAQNDIKLIDWIEPPPTLVSNGLGVDDPSMMTNSATPNRRFVARLEPPIDLPAATASEIYRSLGLDMPQEFKLYTYDGLVLPTGTSTTSRSNENVEQGDRRFLANGRKRQRELYTFRDDDGQPTKKRHEYKFHTFEQAAGRTLRDLPFSHPRQLADVIPVLRQYALLSSLLRGIFPDSETALGNVPKEKSQGAESAKSKMIPTFLSNDDPTASKLDAILSNGDSPSVSAPRASPPSSSVYDAEVKVDVSLRTPMSAAPSILLLFNVPGEAEDTSNGSGGSPTDAVLKTVTLRIDIHLNGRIAVCDVTGVWDDGGSDQDGDSRTAEVEMLCGKLAGVLEACEDVGMLVEWLLRWRRRRRKAA